MTLLAGQKMVWYLALVGNRGDSIQLSDYTVIVELRIHFK